MVELYYSYLAQEASDSSLFLCQLLRFFFCGLGVCRMALEGLLYRGRRSSSSLATGTQNETDAVISLDYISIL